MGKEKNSLYMNHLECIYFRYIFKESLLEKTKTKHRSVVYLCKNGESGKDEF